MPSSPKYPPEFLQRIRDKINLIEIVGEHVVLRKSGSNHTGLCPFHSERTPSFGVSEQKQLYHCHGCRRGGDLFTFVMEIHGLSFPEAVEELADRASIPLPRDVPRDGDPNEDPEAAKRRAAFREKQALAYKLNRFAAAFFHSALPREPHVQEYFRSRGVQGDLARAFYVGAAPPSWDALSRHLASKKAPLELAGELGLIRPSKKNASGYFDLFRNRAMFPILDLRGKVAGFGGRALPLPPGAPDVGGEDSPKYLNSPESLLFKKDRLAFGLYQAQKHVREKDEIILVEGYFDVLALHAAGFQNAVATCGTALTTEHLAVFRRFGGKMIVLFDGDRAGIAAMERAMEVGLEQGIVLYGTVIPEGRDPDEVIGEPDGAARMREILAQAKPLLDVRIDEEVRKASEGPEARTQALKQIAAWLARFKDPVGREVRAEALREKLGLSRPLVDRALSGASVGGKGQGSSPPARPAGELRGPRLMPRKGAGPISALSAREKLLLSGLVQGPEFTKYFSDAEARLPKPMTISDLFDYEPARAFVALLLREPGLLERFRAEPGTALPMDLDAQVLSTLTEALVTAKSGPDPSELKLALERSLGRIWARFSQQIKSALVDAESKQDAGLQAKLMKEYLDVQRKMKEFDSFYEG